MKLKVLLILANRHSGKDKYQAFALIHSNRYKKLYLVASVSFQFIPDRSETVF